MKYKDIFLIFRWSVRFSNIFTGTRNFLTTASYPWYTKHDRMLDCDIKIIKTGSNKLHGWNTCDLCIDMHNIVLYNRAMPVQQYIFWSTKYLLSLYPRFLKIPVYVNNHKQYFKYCNGMYISIFEIPQLDYIITNAIATRHYKCILYTK